MRTLTLGIIAFSWALLTDEAVGIFQIAPSLALSLVSLTFDILQYYAAYFMNLRLLNRIEANNVQGGQFDSQSFLYKARTWLFHLKVYATLLSAAYLLAITFLVVSGTKFSPIGLE